MIGLSTQLFDVNGAHIFYNKDIQFDETTDRRVVRRVSKTATLDPGVFIDDAGYVPGDNDIVLTVTSVDEEQYKQLMDIFKYHPFIILTTPTGNFLCVPSSIRPNRDKVVMEFSTKDNA